MNTLSSKAVMTLQQDLLRQSRRQFLQRAAAFASVAPGATFSSALLTAGGAAAQSAGDYKALVCINLIGGNDQSNTVVPTGNSEYVAYSSARPSLALPRAQLLTLSPQGYSGPAIGLHPSLAAIRPLFLQGRLALVANVGPLVVPLTKSQWNGGSPTVPVPFQLTSHSDQTGAWQTGLPDRPSATGWFGRTGDLLTPLHNLGSQVSMTMSVAGNNALQAGEGTIQYQLTTQGAVRVQALSDLYGSAAGATALRRLVSDPRVTLLENELVRIGARALSAEAVVNSALASASMTTVFPTTHIGQQLRMVARMVAAQSALSQGRQLFFVQLGGFDFHDKLLEDQARLLKELADAMAAFQSAISAIGMSNKVTAFTTSEFGRALQHNGRGSDHGWGGHHFVMGGAVQGGRVYGEFPTVALGGPEDAGQGRLIPTTSVDEYAATLVRWFGVTPANLAQVIPNIGRFARNDLGFMG